MKVVFRVDASYVIGIGHIMRCRTLAAELQNKGNQIHFITRAHLGHLADLLERDGFEVTLLPKPEDVDPSPNAYEAWLGVSQQEDADQTISALSKKQPDWVIVDHYGLDNFWEAQIQLHTHKLMVIDDLANRTHSCDVLLDQNYAACAQKRYQQWVPPHCIQLIGPRYALLRPEYIEHREKMEPRTGTIRRIFVFMGGADNDNITGRILAALSSIALAHLDVDIVIGPNFTNKDEVIDQATKRANTEIHILRPHLADLMARADLAIGAGGTTTWERMCVGLPSLTISIAENQVAVCELLSSSGLIWYLGCSQGISVSAIESYLHDALRMQLQLHAMSIGNKNLVDGRGVKRVVEVIFPTSSSNFTLRPTDIRDVLTHFSWVNESVVRSNSIDTDLIDLTSHLEWFHRKLNDVKSQLYLLETGGLPVGQVRFEQQGDKVKISFSLDVLVRGRGLASQLLKLGIERLNFDQPQLLVATVKPENNESANTFIRLGFVELAADEGSVNRQFQFLLSHSNQVDPTGD